MSARPSLGGFGARDANLHADGRAGVVCRRQVPTPIRQDCPLRATQHVVYAIYTRPYEGMDVAPEAMQAYLDWEFEIRNSATHCLEINANVHWQISTAHLLFYRLLTAISF